MGKLKRSYHSIEKVLGGFLFMASKNRDKEVWFVPKRANVHQMIALLHGIIKETTMVQLGILQSKIPLI